MHQTQKIRRHLAGMVVQLVELLRYKPESRGFDSDWSHWNSSVT
jgi:hypothetical protein